MLKPPNLSWPIRLAALVVAGGMSLYVLQLYVFGSKFVAAVGALSAPAAQPSSPAPFAKREAGVVPVQIIKESKPAH